MSEVYPDQTLIDSAIAHRHTVLTVAVAVMPAPIPEPIRALIQEEFERGYSNDVILAGSYGVGMRTVQRMRSNWVKYGTVFIPTDNPGGRPRVLTQFYEEQLLNYLDERPMSFLDELVYMLFDDYDLIVDESTVWRALHRLGWSRKRMRRTASQRNAHLRDSWFAALADWRADQLIFLDESAANERTGKHPVAFVSQLLRSSGDRKYGWAPLNKTPFVSEEFKRSKRWSLLPAFTIEGYLSWIILQGSVTQEIFINFVRDHVLPYCGSFERNEARSVIICDNASVHHSPELVLMCHDAGVLLKYLPPYSPDLNPIETSFSVLKAWIKRHQDMAVLYFDDGRYGEFLDLAVLAQEDRYDAGNLFRKSGIYYRSQAEMDAAEAEGGG